MNPSGRILLIDDDKSLADSVTVVLESRGYEVTHAPSAASGLKITGSESIDMVLTDFRMPGMDGMELLKHLRTHNSQIPVIMVTAFGTTDLAIEATKSGAFDYLVKPFEMTDLLGIVEKALTASRMTSKQVSIGEASREDSDTIIGSSREMHEVFGNIGRLANKPVTVMIQGETGTGKELVARAIYQHSDRAHKPFIAINCAAIPENLLESELFGHERGAFTSAVTRRIGRFEQANDGTLFLDEIGDLPLRTQVKLLRVVQEKVICTVGGKEDIPIDVRIICATHQDIPKLIGEGRFREDLYYRLNGAIVSLPPLRERRDDIPLLIHYFLGRNSRAFNVDSPHLDEDARQSLISYSWPGNVRQLENVIKRLMIVSNGFAITKQHVLESLELSTSISKEDIDNQCRHDFSRHIRKTLETAVQAESSDVFSILTDELEKEVYTQSLELTQGNQSKISRLLGVSRLTVREKLDKFKLLPKRDSQT